MIKTSFYFREPRYGFRFQCDVISESLFIYIKVKCMVTLEDEETTFCSFQLKITSIRT